MESNKIVEKEKETKDTKESNKEEIQKKLKQNILKIFNQMKKGCSREKCYNIYCAKNLICKKSK